MVLYHKESIIAYAIVQYKTRLCVSAVYMNVNLGILVVSIMRIYKSENLENIQDEKRDSNLYKKISCIRQLRYKKRWQILLVACKNVEFLRFSQFSATRSN